LAKLPELFARKGTPDPAEAEAKEARLYQKIGQLEVELDWLKKICGAPQLNDAR